MRSTVITLFLIAIFSIVSGQESDGLRNYLSIWQDAGQPDSIRYQALHDLGWKLTKMDPDSSLALAEIQLEFAQTHGNQKWIAMALNRYSFYHNTRNEVEKALEFQHKSLDYARQWGEEAFIARSSTKLVNLYFNHGLHEYGVPYLELALKSYKEIGDKVGVGKIQMYFVRLHSYLRDLESSETYLSKAEKNFEAAGYELGLADVSAQRAMIHFKQKENNLALPLLYKALEIRMRKADPEKLYSTYAALCSVLGEIGDFKLAFSYNTKSLLDATKAKYKWGIVNAKVLRGQLYTKTAELDSAVRYCREGRDLALEIGYLRMAAEACKCLSYSYKEQSNLEEAMQAKELYTVLRDSMHELRLAKKLKLIEVAEILAADSTRMERRLEQQARSHQAALDLSAKSRNIYIFLSLCVFVLAAGIYGRLHQIRKEKQEVEEEKRRSDHLLANILPAEVAEELKAKGKTNARQFEEVSILFTDFKEFTEISRDLDAQDVLDEINHCFRHFDFVVEKYGIEKIKTVGDGYMAAGGFPEPAHDSASNTILAAIEMQEFMARRKVEREKAGKFAFEMRAGVNTGPVVAGIVGVKKFQYDMWGDTVNTASRMESHGVIGQVNISGSTMGKVKDDPRFRFASRGTMQVKGKGEVEMFIVYPAEW